MGNAGFNLCRSDNSAAAPPTLLAHVSSQAPGSTADAAYSPGDITRNNAGNRAAQTMELAKNRVDKRLLGCYS